MFDVGDLINHLHTVQLWKPERKAGFTPLIYFLLKLQHDLWGISKQTKNLPHNVPGDLELPDSVIKDFHDFWGY